MLDFNVLYGILIAIGIGVIVRYIFPFFKAKGMQESIYEDVKIGLLLFGYAFREEKVKRMVAMLYNLVSDIEQMDIAPTNKRDIAVVKAFDSILDEFNIVLDEEAIELIIDIMVAYLPPTNKE